MEQLLFQFQILMFQYVDTHRLIVPLGIIGLWRWSVWLFKELVALRYRPARGQYSTSVSIVTPVYNEDPQVFTQAIRSWIDNRPAEIIAVIDYSDQKSIQIFKQFQKRYPNLRLVITQTPGKRPALATGIKTASSKIVALVDSDTLWSDNLLDKSLPPFRDSKVAGVGTYQSVLQPKTLAQKIFDIQLDLRYHDDFPFLAAAGDALVCLSGRTAFYRREVLLPLLDQLVNEKFFGQPVISGDDKRLTYLVLQNGWKVAFQSNARVYTPGMENFSSYMKQRIRWARNSLRADLKALIQGWPFRHPALAFFQIDKFLKSFVLILSPIYFLIAIWLQLWPIAILIFIWWFLSRSIKLYPHLQQKPQDIHMLPFFVFYTFVVAVINVYALFTLNTQGWITRWDKARLPRLTFIQSFSGFAATASAIILITFLVYVLKQNFYFAPINRQNQLISQVLASSQTIQQTTEVEAGLTTEGKGSSVDRYIVQPGDTLSSIAAAYGISQTNLLYANISRLPNWNQLDPGLVLSVPGPSIQLTPQSNFNYQRIYPDPRIITYNQSTNTIEIFGRGNTVTLSEIQNSVGEDLIREVSPGQWYLSANLFLHSGTSLQLSPPEVNWLKLKSDDNGYVYILTYNAVLHSNQVKITSWDLAKNSVDQNWEDGRSFILAKDGSRMDLFNSELAYLGFPRSPEMTMSTYGVSWRMSNGRLGSTILTGQVINSQFHHNYFGAYTFGATGITWRGNQFYENIRYGLDPHDDSNGFLVENNAAFNNGSHGIIFSKRCINNIIRNNISYNNKLHGIMLHEQSDHNVIENNTLYGNTDGIALWHSSRNFISNNRIYDNRQGIRANAASINNLLTGNTISRNENGIHLYNQAGNNIVDSNLLVNNNQAIYIKTNQNLVRGNTVEKNRGAVTLAEQASANNLVANRITYNLGYGIYAKLLPENQNNINDNFLQWNRKDLWVTDQTKTN